LIKIIILEENFKWHLEAFASELFIYIQTHKMAVNKNETEKYEHLSAIKKGRNRAGREIYEH